MKIRHIEPDLRTVRVNGVELAYWERNEAKPNLPTLLFVHATGFHGRVFDRIIESFADYHTLCLEQRGHGRSTKVRIEHWRSQGEDVAAFVEALGLENLLGVGHSMGAHAMVDAAARSGGFDRLMVLDPTIPSPEAFNGTEWLSFEGGMHPAAKRKNDFASPEEMVERILPKGAYPLFERRILDDYCRYGLIEKADGRYELACPPEVEASVYMTSRTNSEIYNRVRTLTIPVTILRAMEPSEAHPRGDFSVSPTWPGLVNEFPNAREFYYPDCTHFIPMQIPDEVIRILREEVDAWLTQGAEHQLRK